MSKSHHLHLCVAADAQSLKGTVWLIGIKKKGAKDGLLPPPPIMHIMSIVAPLRVVASPPCTAPKATGKGAVFIFDIGERGRLFGHSLVAEQV